MPGQRGDAAPGCPHAFTKVFRKVLAFSSCYICGPQLGRPRVVKVVYVSWTVARKFSRDASCRGIGASAHQDELALVAGATARWQEEFLSVEAVFGAETSVRGSSRIVELRGCKIYLEVEFTVPTV